MKKFDSKHDTKKHIRKVRKYLNLFLNHISIRADNHDKTKLKAPEKELFDIMTPKLKNSTYGSEEYNEFLKELKPALDHHYYHNRHHPEYFMVDPAANTACFSSPLERMNLIDIIEMVCDWKAASERHADGDIMKSIEINQERFGYTDELKMILINTAILLNDK